jgi:transposase
VYKSLDIVTIIWHHATNDEMYEDGTGYHRGEIKNRKLGRLNFLD